jgi:gamma-aminobutyric acid type B receptor
MNKTLAEFAYGDAEMNQLIVESFYQVRFLGIRDYITFSQDGSASGIIAIAQQIGQMPNHTQN